MMRAASCHSSCMFPSSCFFSSRSAIIVIPLGSLGRRRRAKELPLISLSMLSLFSGKKSYAYKRLVINQRQIIKRVEESRKGLGWDFDLLAFYDFEIKGFLICQTFNSGKFLRDRLLFTSPPFLLKTMWSSQNSPPPPSPCRSWNK